MIRPLRRAHRAAILLLAVLLPLLLALALSARRSPADFLGVGPWALGVGRWELGVDLFWSSASGDRA